MLYRQSKSLYCDATGAWCHRPNVWIAKIAKSVSSQNALSVPKSRGLCSVLGLKWKGLNKALPSSAPCSGRMSGWLKAFVTASYIAKSRGLCPILGLKWKGLNEAVPSVAPCS
ncbi:hypothetical protein PoB_006319800 [Plakobranchus ocellatus]|uniref:Uncharacterized protein n=1 Tax=Plakobranchus ocellatus TaxID=259542 RepID=A0AAV4CXP3_9GAST|nr:hypothetical protein PoB_006319800 [Plakobranchus ocellatus]